MFTHLAYCCSLLLPMTYARHATLPFVFWHIGRRLDSRQKTSHCIINDIGMSGVEWSKSSRRYFPRFELGSQETSSQEDATSYRLILKIKVVTLFLLYRGLCNRHALHIASPCWQPTWAMKIVTTKTLQKRCIHKACQ